jgi:hypothetical protein
MILTKYVTVRIINHNIEHYEKLGYEIKYGDKITIPTQHLSLGSHCKIMVCCPICNKKKEIKYQDYIKITKNYTNEYYCFNCVKNKKTK